MDLYREWAHVVGNMVSRRGDTEATTANRFGEPGGQCAVLAIAINEILDKPGRDERLRVLSLLTGERLSTTKDLSQAQAAWLIDWLLFPETEPGDGLYSNEAWVLLPALQKGKVDVQRAA